MLWQLPASVRSLALSTCRRYGVTTPTHTQAPEPLRILFCGSDDFSIASLRALTAAKHDLPSLIHSIHVVHRPAKPTGRGLKTLREVPIKHTATEELKLDTHVIDTFTGWTPPVPINLVVAVSFGLLVPPRILGLARYGGINVHPSLLPDLRGAAPIEHAILKRRERTGVSIQTLHPTHFDQGSVLAQTSAPGMQIPRDMTATALQDQLATAGAQMLVDVLKSQKYVPPHQDAGWYAASKGPIEHAPKITKQDRFVDFSERTMDEILAIQQALGNPWCILPNGDRLIMHKVADAQKMDTLGHGAGIWMQEKAEYPTFRAACGRFGMILESTYAGTKAGQGNAKLLRVLPVRGGYYEVAGR